MEVAIIQNDVSRGITVSHRQVLVQDKLQTWIPCKVAFHLYRTINRAIDNISARVKQYVYLLENIHEYFVLLIFTD